MVQMDYGIGDIKLARCLKDYVQPQISFVSGRRRQAEEITLLSLAPLTTIAQLIESDDEDAACPDIMSAYKRIVVLGGAKFGGNTTPVTEFNLWQDPEAAEIVLASEIPVEVVPLDASEQLIITLGDLQRLSGTETVIDFLIQPLDPTDPYSSPLQMYIFSFGDSAALSDPVAAILALRPELGKAEQAIIEVQSGNQTPELVRGQSIISTNILEQILMHAGDELLTYFSNQLYPDPPTPPYYDDFQDWYQFDFYPWLFENYVPVVTDIDERLVKQSLVQGLVKSTIISSSNVEDEMSVAGSETGQQIFLPAIVTD